MLAILDQLYKLFIEIQHIKRSAQLISIPTDKPTNRTSLQLLPFIAYGKCYSVILTLIDISYFLMLGIQNFTKLCVLLFLAPPVDIIFVRLS